MKIIACQYYLLRTLICGCNLSIWNLDHVSATVFCSRMHEFGVQFRVWILCTNDIPYKMYKLQLLRAVSITVLHQMSCLSTCYPTNVSLLYFFTLVENGFHGVPRSWKVRYSSYGLRVNLLFNFWFYLGQRNKCFTSIIPDSSSFVLSEGLIQHYVCYSRSLRWRHLYCSSSTLFLQFDDMFIPLCCVTQTMVISRRGFSGISTQFHHAQCTQ